MPAMSPDGCAVAWSIASSKGTLDAFESFVSYVSAEVVPASGVLVMRLLALLHIFTGSMWPRTGACVCDASSSIAAYFYGIHVATTRCADRQNHILERIQPHLKGQ
jgi:hypothetical protein